MQPKHDRELPPLPASATHRVAQRRHSDVPPMFLVPPGEQPMPGMFDTSGGKPTMIGALFVALAASALLVFVAAKMVAAVGGLFQ